MHGAIYGKLTEVARERGLTTDGEIAPLAGLDPASPADRDTLSGYLDEIARHEQEHGRPMLTALVIHRGESELVGDPFFALARAFGRHTGGVPNRQFHLDEVKRVHAQWT